MAITTTSLASAFSASSLTFKATSATGATVGGIAKVDNEYMDILAINGTAISVSQRGKFGGQVQAHAVLAPVQFGLASDMPNPVATQLIAEPVQQDFLSIGANGAIACPTRNTTFVIDKGSALASSTLADPGAGQNGLEVTFLTGSNFAHVVTLVNGFDGTTGTSTTFTSAAFKGAAFTVVAVNGTWFVKSNNLYTIT